MYVHRLATVSCTVSYAFQLQPPAGVALAHTHCALKTNSPAPLYVLYVTALLKIVNSGRNYSKNSGRCRPIQRRYWMGNAHYTRLQKAQLEALLIEGKTSNQAIADLLFCSVRQIRRYRKTLEVTGTIYHAQTSAYNALKLPEAALLIRYLPCFLPRFLFLTLIKSSLTC